MTSRQTSQPNMLGGAVIIRPDNDPFPHGGRDLAGQTITNRRVPVRLGGDRAGDRYVSLTNTRLHATTVYVVAEVDGTGRLADTRLTVTPDLSRARQTANRLVGRWGGVAEAEEN